MVMHSNICAEAYCICAVSRWREDNVLIEANETVIGWDVLLKMLKEIKWEVREAENWISNKAGTKIGI